VLARIGVIRPLRHRDFALLWTGLTVSMLGDGVYLVAIAWQVYELSDTPTALSVVGAAWTLPTVLLLLAGGVLSDRVDRRLLMVAADVLRAAAIGAIAVLSISGELELWHLLVLVAFYGVGEALFNPAATAITPMLVPADDLVQANALEHLVRPLALRFLGPAIGGLLVATVGPGTGFALDAGSFLVSALCILAIRPHPGPAAEPGRSMLAEVREGFAYVRSQPWLWATLGAASLSLLAFMGPLQVLLPDRLKNDLGFGAGTFGAVLAVGGLGRIATAVVLGQRGLPRRFMTGMYLAWSLATLAVAGFGLSTATWQFMAIALLAGVCDTLGNVTWGTLIQTRVPSHLLGRVSSVDWQVSIALIPISFGLAGPIAEAIGTQATLIGAGVIGACSGMVFLLLPGVRDPEREPAATPPTPAPPRPDRDPV
jgi:DHA3 family tetracycline resistance protein-like MFS transporter